MPVQLLSLPQASQQSRWKPPSLSKVKANTQLAWQEWSPSLRWSEVALMESVWDLLPAQLSQDFCTVQKPHSSELENRSVHASQNNLNQTGLSSSSGKQDSKEGALTVLPFSEGRERVLKTGAYNILSCSKYARLIIRACSIRSRHHCPSLQHKHIRCHHKVYGTILFEGLVWMQLLYYSLITNCWCWHVCVPN